MNKGLKCLLLSFAMSLASQAQAHMPGPAHCTRSANLLACVDADGNAYSVNTVGTTLYLRGFEKNGHRYWAQTNSRFGQLTFLPASPPMARLGLAIPAVSAGQPSTASPARAVAAQGSLAAGLRAASEILFMKKASLNGLL